MFRQATHRLDALRVSIQAQSWWLLGSLVGVAVICNLLLLFPIPNVAQSWAALGLAILVPGMLLEEALLSRRVATISPAERFVIGVGLGFVVMVLLLLGLSYLPGDLTFAVIAVAMNGLLLLLVLLNLLLQRRNEPPAEQPSRISALSPLLPVVVLLAGAAFLRFTNIGYSELHGDEALVSLRAADVIQGWERALFVHKKGPGEILTGTAFYLLTGELTEYAAHLPFAFASWVGVWATYLLGRRWFGPVAGWWAGAMVAVDGYLMAFGRMLQYQSLIFLLTVLSVLVVQRAVDQPQRARRYLFTAALLAATGLLYHYEAVIIGIPALWLLVGLWRAQAGSPWIATGQLLRRLALPLGVGVAILAAFYVPFVLDPEFFRDTYYYIFDYRLAGHTVPDGLAVIVGRSTLYSSSYYFWTLVLLTGTGLMLLYRRLTTPVLHWLCGLLLIGVLLAMILAPVSFAELPWRLAPLLVALGVAPAWFGPRVQPGERAAWLWFGVTMIGVLFFVRKPGTHVYIFFVPWALVSGWAVGQVWDIVARRWKPTVARAVLAPTMLLLALIFGNYVYQLFVVNQVEVLRTWDENRPAGYWTSYDTPTFESIFGFPIRNGWQTVAMLYATGEMQGRFDTNDRFSMVPDWYLRGEGYCPRDEGKYYLLVPYPLAADRSVVDEQRRQLAEDYALWGVVTTNGAPHMEIYTKRALVDLPADHTPQEFASEAYVPVYNETMLAPFTRNGPLGAQPIPNPTAIRYGEHISLLGYQLGQNSTVAGGEVEVTLYWSTDALLTEDFYVSIQLIDLSDATKAGQRDGEPGCNRFPTSSWIPGDRIYDRYHVPIQDAVRPGTYSVLVKLYQLGADGQQITLPATLPNGESADGAVVAELTIE